MCRATERTIVRIHLYPYEWLHASCANNPNAVVILDWTNSTYVRLSPVSVDHLTPLHQPSNHTRLQTFAGSARITRIWQRPKRRKRSGWFCFSLVIVRVGVSALVGPASRSLSGSFRLGRRGVTVFVSPTAVTRVHFTDDWVGVRYQFTQRV